MKKKLARRKFLRAAAIVAIVGANPGVRFAARARADAPVQLPKTIRVGIIGLDGHYGEITEAAKRIPSLQITAVAETKPGLIRQMAGNPLLARATLYDDYRKLLEAEKLDIVAECGENGNRAAVLQACAEHRLPIVAEKPLAMSLSELAAVRQAITAKRVPLTMLLSMRCEPSYQGLKNIVASGRIGTVVAMNAQKSYKLGARPEWMKHRESFGGTIPYIGIHLLDLMRWISGREFVEAAAFQSTVEAPQIGDMENNAGVIFRLDNRGTASMHLDYLRPGAAATHGDDRLRVVGTKGIAEYQAASGVTLITENQAQTKIVDLPPASLLFGDFVESLYSGKPHLIRAEDVYRVTEIVLKVRAAAEEGRLVQL
jgi:predicted dehydrogenase